jgi:hypothetical protein
LGAVRGETEGFLLAGSFGVLKLASADPNLPQQVSFWVACDFQSQGCLEKHPLRMLSLNR